MLRPRRLPRTALVGATGVAFLFLALGAIRLLPLVNGDDPPGGVPLAIYAEFGDLADRVYSIPADDPSKRTLLATLDHAPGWGINPAATTRGDRAVFLLAPTNGGGRDTPAEVWTLDLKTGERTRIAADADLLIQPVVNRDGTILYRRSNGQRQEIVRLDIGNAARTAVFAEETTFGIFPIGEDAEGNLIVARLSTSGTDLLRVQNGVSQVAAHASDHLARGWQMAPDGKSLAYLAPEVRNDRVVYRVHVVSLPTGKEQSLPETPAHTDQFNPVWTPDGTGLAIGQDARDGASPVVVLEGNRARTLSAPPRGFDVPLSWSAGAAYLAVRSFDGSDATTAGNETTIVVGADGRRHAITSTGELIFIGWVTGE